MPELPDIVAYIDALETRIVGQPLERVRLAKPVSAAHHRSAGRGSRRPDGARTSPRRQAHRDRSGRRSLAGAAPDDRRPAALASAGSQTGRPPDAGGLRFSRTARSRSPKRAPSGVRRCTSCAARIACSSLDAGGIDVFTADPASFQRGTRLGESHAEASAHRSTADQRHRQCLLGRDSACRATVADHTDAEAETGRVGPPVRRHAHARWNIGSNA